MINVLMPIAGDSIFYENDNYHYPKILSEVKGKPMIERVIDNLLEIKEELHFTFVVKEQDCREYHFKEILTLLTNGTSTVIEVKQKTSGALCSTMLAIDQVDAELPLIICNADQLFRIDLNEVLADFESIDINAGVICIEAVHPRWSYVKIDGDGMVTQASEKRPISRDAIAGFFYYKKAGYFFESAKRSIINDANVNGLYYIAPSLNELMLMGMKIACKKIANESYYSFYSPKLLEAYNRAL